eukprot:CAMPEP_0178896896 /NCGR_PEP_ID=MMETSP0786-20121207/1440_1 /TAXON_ID=186022 /ORGANISM="Thalassionema frauenfeldii, Strain CCMP 1798" /LENGTH=326 /DNA_ID=CAMNT_0020567375 /DNA_START=22 /DNA_END=1003 /DNA_ORIENTATION=-
MDRSSSRPAAPPTRGVNETLPWNSCFGRGPAEQYISYFYGKEAAEYMGYLGAPIGPFPDGAGDDCSAQDDSTASNSGRCRNHRCFVSFSVLAAEEGSTSSFRTGEAVNGPKESAKVGSNESVNIHSDILVSTQDDISTLGEPNVEVMQINHATERDDTVASLDYDYEIEKIKNQKPESIRIASLLDNHENNKKTGSSSDFSSPTFGKSKLDDSLFADDASFERQFTNQMDERVEVVAPAGKLGMVIDTPSGGVPVVHAIKNSSVLANEIMVGDRLISVDDEDTTEYTAVQVSKLISQKEKQEKRILTFLRTKAPSNRTTSLENLTS